MSVNVEKYAVNDVDMPGDWHVGEEEPTICPKCMRDANRLG